MLQPLHLKEAGSHSELDVFVKQNIMKVVVVEIERVIGVLRAVLLNRVRFLSVCPRGARPERPPALLPLMLYAVSVNDCNRLFSVSRDNGAG